MRKQSDAQIIGREGERWFSSVLPPEWTIQRPLDDFGLDGIIAVGDRAHVSHYEFGVQVKSSTDFRKTRGAVVVPQIPRETIVYWLSKFFPTLLVAYDTKNKIGYFDWIPNLVDRDQFNSKNAYFYLHISQERVVSPSCWSMIKSELSEYHHEFSTALRAKTEILPLATEFATLLRNLCASNMADKDVEDQHMSWLLIQAWTHMEVIRQLDELLPNVVSGSVAERNLKSFRDAYFRACDTVFHDFAKVCETRDTQWIFMRKDSEPILNELTAMLADCVRGLLRHANR